MERKDRFLIYSTPSNDVKVDVFLQDETVWLTQKAMAELFGVQVPAISKHLKNIFQEGELDEKVVISILETTTEHGTIEGKTQTQQTQFYNLDAIISVGYRVNSIQATHFRIWASKAGNEYRYFMVYDRRNVDGAHNLDGFLKIMREL